MRIAAVTTRVSVCLLAFLMTVSMASAQWDPAVLETVASGPDFDMLGRRAMGIDEWGTVHAIYRRGVGIDQVLYYTSKPAGGAWSEPEVLGAPGTYPGTGWLEIRKETGEPYVVFFRFHVLTLGIRRSGGWEFHTLDTPAEYGVGKPAMTVDAAGYAHIAMLVDRDDPQIWQMGYGYWDGSPDFHFQLLDRSLVPHFGLFAQPDIVARKDGSVAIAYHHDDLGNYIIMVAENDELGGIGWYNEKVDVPWVIVYPESLEIGRSGDLHVAFHTNIELGADHHVYYASRKGKKFGTPIEVGGPFTGARPRLTLTRNGKPHLVFEETLGPRATGRLVHAYKGPGGWIQEVVMDDEAFTPSFVMDAAGNGNLLFERKIVHMEDNDVEYYGYCEPTQ